jgi:hypothetical protein
MISKPFDHAFAGDRVVLASVCRLLTGGLQDFNTNLGFTVVLKHSMSYEAIRDPSGNSSSQLQ